MDKKRIIAYEDVAVRVGERSILHNTNWEIKEGEHWAILGPNGSGKSSLVHTLIDDYTVIKGYVHHLYRGRLGYVSFASHRRTLRREKSRDTARHYSGNIDQKTRARDLLYDIELSDPALRDKIFDTLSIKPLLNRGIVDLSTGELRKVLIALELLKTPRVLVLDEPFDGLDIKSRPVLSESLENLMTEDMTLILITHRFEEITPGITHIMGLKDCSILFQGARPQIEKSGCIASLYSSSDGTFPDKQAGLLSAAHQRSTDRLIEMSNVSVTYSGCTIFSGLNWVLRGGENWEILGPNGCGKSTLLSLINGDNPQAYSQDIVLFGRSRGSGESIWEIKEKIGFISTELQIGFREKMSVVEVVLSGFFDSNGLFQRPSDDQLQTARYWLKALSISTTEDSVFDHLSFGEQRLILLARSMVKLPVLLILDEPCQGLDPVNRGMVLDVINWIGSETKTSILYVTHHEDDLLPCFTNRLVFEKREGFPTFSTRVELL
jgi:molybdate transport system ATP-binding protein